MLASASKSSRVNQAYDDVEACRGRDAKVVCSADLVKKALSGHSILNDKPESKVAWG